MPKDEINTISPQKYEAQLIIKDLRKRYGWSQERMAQVLGVRRSTISDWERGVSLSRETLIGIKIGIAAAMGLPPEELIYSIPEYGGSTVTETPGQYK